MGLDISKIANAELKRLAFLKDENNNGKLEEKELTVFKAEAAALKGVSAEDFNQAMGLYQSNPIKANKGEKEKAVVVEHDVRRKDMRNHRDSIKNTLKEMVKADFLYTTKKDLENTLKEKFAHKEYEALHAEIAQVLSFIPEVNNKKDVKNIKETVRKQLKMTEFQKDVLDQVVKMVENTQIQKELDNAVEKYNNTRAENKNYETAYKNTKKGIKGSYDGEVKDRLKDHAKADATNYVDDLAVANETHTRVKDMKKALKQQVKGDAFARDAVKDKNNMIKNAVRRNKFENNETNMTAENIKKEVGYDLYQKLNQSYLPAHQTENTFDLHTLADIVRRRMGSNYLIHKSQDIPMEELNLIKKDFEVEIKDTLTNKEVKKLIELVKAEIAPKDRSFGTIAKKSIGGVVPGLLAALATSKTLNVKQNVTIVTNVAALEDLESSFAGSNFTPIIEKLEDGKIRVEINQEVFHDQRLLDGLIGAGIGIASKLLAALIFGNTDYERSCVSIADFDPEDSRYTDLASYNEYLSERLPKEKVDMLMKIAESCKNDKGEFDKSQFDSLMKHIAGVGSVISCGELKAHSKGIAPSKPVKYEKAEEIQEEEDTPPAPQDKITTSHYEKFDTKAEEVPAINASDKQWPEIAAQYKCLVNKYGEYATIRMIKIAQAINNGDYSEENLVKLYRQSLKGLSKMKNIDGVDYAKYESVYNATYLPNKEYDKDGNYIKGTGLKVPNVLAGCKRDANGTKEVTKVRNAEGDEIVAPKGHAADNVSKTVKVTVYGVRVNGGALETFKDAETANKRLNELKAQYPNAKVECLEWAEFIKENENENK